MCKSNLLRSGLISKCNAQFAEAQNVFLNKQQKAFAALKHFALVQFINFGATANYSYTDRCSALRETAGDKYRN
jgi:hypothetical protein